MPGNNQWTGILINKPYHEMFLLTCFCRLSRNFEATLRKIWVSTLSNKLSQYCRLHVGVSARQSFWPTVYTFLGIWSWRRTSWFLQVWKQFILMLFFAVVPQNNWIRQSESMSFLISVLLLLLDNICISRELKQTVFKKDDLKVTQPNQMQSKIQCTCCSDAQMNSIKTSL